MKRMTIQKPLAIKYKGSLTIEWMKTNEVAKYLITSPNNVRNMVYRGLLSPRRFNGRLYFSTAEVSRLIDLKGEQYVD